MRHHNRIIFTAEHEISLLFLFLRLTFYLLSYYIHVAQGSVPAPQIARREFNHLTLIKLILHTVQLRSKTRESR